jgi:Ca2+-binding RTX toxin-like protein
MPLSDKDFQFTPGATGADKADFNKALQYLVRAPDGAAAMQQIADMNIKINIIHDGQDSYNPTTKTINWDPNSPSTVIANPDGGSIFDEKKSVTVGVQSAALGLAHEAGHAIDPNPQAIQNIPDPNYGDLGDKFAIQLENKIAAFHGEPQRFNHGGIPIRADDPTEHTAVTSAGNMVWVQSDGAGNLTIQGTYEFGTYPEKAPTGGGTGTGTLTIDGPDITISPDLHRGVVVKGDNDTVIEDGGSITVSGGSATIVGSGNSITLDNTSGGTLELSGTGNTVKSGDETISVGSGTSAIDYNGRQKVTGVTTTFQNGSAQEREFDPGNTHPYNELDVTKGADGKVAAAQVVLDQQFISAGVSVGQIFGSALGTALGGKDQLTKLVGSVAGGAVGALIGQKFAQVVATSLTADLSKVSVADVFAGKNLDITSAGIGAVASFLTAEIGTALKIPGFGGTLFNAAANGFTVSVLTQVTNKIAAGLTFDAAIGAIDWGGAVIGAANGVDLSIGGILGGYLGHELVPAQTHEGAVGGQLLGAVGSAVGLLLAQGLGAVLNFIIPGVGSLIGTVLGTLIGDHFGNTPHPAAIDLVDQAGYLYGYGHYQVSEGGSYDNPDQMARATDDIINAYLKAVNGAALDQSKQTWTGYVTDPNFRYINGEVPTHKYLSFISPDDAVHAAALDVLQHTEVIGGDLLLKRAHYNSPSNIPDPGPEWNGLTAASSQSGAEKLVIMSADLRVAQDYENYLNNREAINALMAANPDSAFTAGWIATFARVNDLGLNHVAPSDFLGGLVGYLDSVNKAGLGVVAANASVRPGPGAGFTVEIGTANGIEVPGALSVFADQVNVTSNAGGQTVQLAFNSALAVGVHAVASGGGNGIWFGIAGAGASAGFNASASANAILVGSAANDTLSGSNGWDFIDGGTGIDTLSGGAGNDILRGGKDTDYLYGGAGNDSYLFNRGDGADSVYDDSGFDVLQFGVGITISDVSIRQSGTDLTVTVRDPANTDVAFDSLADRIVLYNGLGAGNRIETFRFADGAALDPAAALRGGAGADSLNDGGTPRWMLGGPGDDNYAVSNVSDLITENAGEGIDSVSSSISFALGPNVENLWLAGTAALNGTGNGAANSLAGNGGDNFLYGLGGSDWLYGQGGNDRLDGGAGADNMAGGTGDDLYIVDNAGDAVYEFAGEGNDTVRSSVSFTLSANVENLTLTGTAVVGTGNDGANSIGGNDAGDLLNGLGGNDTLYSGSGNDRLNGGDGNDQLYGQGGNDTLDGGGGADNMVGGTGDDLYIVDDVNDAVTEYANQGTDAVSSSASFTLSANVENLTLTGSAAIDGSGNDTANILAGNGGANTLRGYGGADSLYGQGGDDWLDGGTGADRMEGGTGDDTYVVDNAFDVIYENAGEGHDWVKSSVSFTLAANVEDLTLTGAVGLTGIGNDAGNGIGGNDGSCILYGLGGNDTLYSGSGNDALYGGSGSDWLYGQGGDDTLDGGSGPDNMAGGTGDDTYYVDNSADVIYENAGEGHDWVKSSVSFTLAANVEDLTLTGAVGLTGTGNDAGNGIGGNDGGCILYGLGGNDTLYSGSGNDALYGGSGSDWLYGQGGDDTLDGGSGADNMAGGTGDDTYYVDNSADVIYENAGEGNDSVQSSVSYTLAANLEALVLTAAGTIGTGNDAANAIGGNDGGCILYGLGGNDTLYSGSGNDALYGGADSDWLYGQGGNDTLDGGSGADNMAGGTGDDSYYVDNAFDVIYEFAGEGNDTVQSSISFTLAASLENLSLTGSAGLTGIGNDAANGIGGNDGGCILYGLGGNDTLYSGSGNDVLYGGADSDWLYGQGGNDTLDGGTGADNMAGGTGDDLYVVDNANDVIYEFDGEGTDTVQSSVSFTLAANLEKLTLTGTASIDGTGNSADNIMLGNSGNNILDGGAGADSLTGGAGNDVYVVDNAGDMVIENAGEGNDTVRSSIGYVLLADVENLTLTDTGSINGTGNAAGNIMLGNSGNNLLSGLDGNDSITGGGGNDSISGGAGNDTAVFSGAKANYSVAYDYLAHSFTVTDQRAGSPDGTDTVTGVENFQFADGSVAGSWFTNRSVALAANPFDFNGDGKSDMLLLNDSNHGVYVCDMNGALMGDNTLSFYIGAGFGWQYKGLGDFNGDSKSDIVLLNFTTTGVYVCEMDGTHLGTSAQAFMISQAFGWNYGDVGDFNGDGKSDILLLNGTTHGVYVCEMDGTQLGANGQAFFIEAAAGWRYQGLGDFNGDGKSDILLLNDVTHGVCVSEMDGTAQATSAQAFSIEAGAGWRYQDLGDFNGDGKSDILLLNDSTHGIYVCDMNGTAVGASGLAGAIDAAAGWRFADSGDFNGDGKTDLLLLNDLTHGVAVGQMDGTLMVANQQVGTMTAGYHYSEKGDFNGDGRMDLVFQNDATHDVELWQMNGTNVPQISHVVTLVGDWHLAL